MRLTIKRRLILVTISVIVLVIIQGVTQFVIIAVNNRQVAIVDRHYEQIILLRERFIDHLKWVNRLQEVVMTNERFDGQVDPTKCAFGKWYYETKGAPAYSGFTKEQRELFDRIEPLHSALHHSAEAINGEKVRDRRMAILKGESAESLKNIAALFNEFVDRERARLKSNEDWWATWSYLTLIAGAVLMVVLVLTAGGSGISLSRFIIGRISRMREGVQKLTMGRLDEGMQFKKVKCSELRNCKKEDCAMYETMNCSCFIEVGSFAPTVGNAISCPAILKGTFKDCVECPVMQTVAPDELTEMGILIDVFRDKLRGIIGTILQTSVLLNSFASEMGTSSQGFSSNAQSQAASAEEVSATVEEVSAGVEHIAESARQQFAKMTSLIETINGLAAAITDMGHRVNETSALTGAITEQAHTGEGHLRDMNNSMGKIHQSSSEMSGIVGIITDISEKINLLSLNAAIEAARAGETGRGFAVVADEVSKLAEQTAQSIKSINTLILGNSAEIERGMSIVNSTVGAISSIIEGVNQSSDKMRSVHESMQKQLAASVDVRDQAQDVKEKSDEIKTATQEQKSAFDEIVKSISVINELTQSNASGAEEITAATDNLRLLSESLGNDVGFFKA